MIIREDFSQSYTGDISEQDFCTDFPGGSGFKIKKIASALYFDQTMKKVLAREEARKKRFSK